MSLKTSVSLKRRTVRKMTAVPRIGYAQVVQEDMALNQALVAPSTQTMELLSREVYYQQHMRYGSEKMLQAASMEIAYLHETVQSLRKLVAKERSLALMYKQLWMSDAKAKKSDTTGLRELMNAGTKRKCDFFDNNIESKQAKKQDALTEPRGLYEPLDALDIL